MLMIEPRVGCFTNGVVYGLFENQMFTSQNIPVR